jgi:hypothetical protein
MPPTPMPDVRRFVAADHRLPASEGGGSVGEVKRLLIPAMMLSFLVAAPAAEAVSRADARDAARQALRRELRQHGARLHVRSQPVTKGARVGQGGPPARLKRVKAKAWLFWLDQAPGAGFVHPSVLVLVDRRTGHVVRKQRLSWWPVVNGRRQFTTDRGRRVKPPPRRAHASIVPGFANDCVVTIGDRVDPYFLKGMAAINQAGTKHGMPVAAAQTPAELGAKIDELARRNPPCTDVMIYIAAHGYAPAAAGIPVDKVARSDKAQVQIKSTVSGAQPETLDVDQVRKVMHDRPSLSFKLVVESCFSGRWTVAMAEPNLRIVLTSSSATEVTFLAVTDPKQGHQVQGKLVLKGDDVTDADGAGDPPPFTKGVVNAIDDWAASDAERAKGEELGKALGYAGRHREGDKARFLGWQHGQTTDRTDERPHAKPPPPAPVAFSLDVNGSYRHIGPGDSETCWTVQTSPARPGATVHVTVTGPGVVAQPAAAVTDASGFAFVRVKINDYGTYHADVEVIATDGGRATGSEDVTVPVVQGTCPPP